MILRQKNEFRVGTIFALIMKDNLGKKALEHDSKAKE
jgi:hypothetical protein